jgi:hypothetical protein
MKSTCFAILALTLLIGSSAFSASAQEFPKRKPGLWKISITKENSEKGPGDSEQCIDEATDAALMSQGMGLSKGMCKKYETRHEGDKIIADSECNVMGSQINSHTETTGDFNSSYSTTVHSKNVPPLMGKSESNMKITATWIGACKANQKPGDITLANGMTINAIDAMNTMANMASGKGADPALIKKMMEQQQQKKAAQP